MIRGIALGEIKIGDWFRLLRKEVFIAVSMGLTMGFVVSFIGVWRGGIDVAIIVALAMVVIVIVGSTIGMCLPFILGKLNLDPATASGPLITSISDIAGVIIYFSIAPGI